MSRNIMILVSLFITIFLLVTAGGVIRATTAPKPASTTELEQAYQQREAEYAKLLTEANQRLEQANKQIEVLSAQNSQPTATAQPAPALDPQKALQIASEAAGQSAVAQGQPQLVNFEQNTAYEVTFDKGIIYVDATNGKVLFNGIPQEITPDQAGQIAVAYLKGGKVYKVEKDTFKDAPVYKVTFWAGYIVDVNMQGQVVYVKLIKEQAVASTTAQDSGSSSGSSSHEHEDEGHDD